MIRETNIYYTAEWIDDENALNENWLGKTIDEAISVAHELAREHGCSPVIIETRVEKNLVMQIRK